MAVFNQLGSQRNNNNNFLTSFQQFAQNYRGNPQQQIQQMLNSGQITQAQYQQAVQKANALRQLFGI